MSVFYTEFHKKTVLFYYMLFFLSLIFLKFIILTEHKILIKQTYPSDDKLLSVKIRLQVRSLRF